MKVRTYILFQAGICIVLAAGLVVIGTLLNPGLAAVHPALPGVFTLLAAVAALVLFLGLADIARSLLTGKRVWNGG